MHHRRLKPLLSPVSARNLTTILFLSTSFARVNATTTAAAATASAVTGRNWIQRTSASTFATTSTAFQHPSTRSNLSNTFGIRRKSTSTSSSTSSLNMSSKPKVLVPISDGSEEIETTCITDTLVRFGADVRIASVKPNGELVCTMSRGVKVMADCTIDEAAAEDGGNWDLIVLPGGMPGAEHLRDCETLTKLLQKQKSDGKYYGAICAAPAVALASNKLIDEGATGIATCYPAPKFREILGSRRSDDRVVQTGHLITSQGPGTALQFGLKLGEILFSKEKRDQIAKEMLFE